MKSKNHRSVKNQNDSSRSWVKLASVFSTYLIITALLIFIVSALVEGSGILGDAGGTEEVSLSHLIADVGEEKVQKVVVDGDRLKADYKDGTAKVALKEPGISFYEILEKAGLVKQAELVEIEVVTPMFGGVLGIIISNLLPILVMIVFFLFLFRQAGKTAGGMFDFGKSGAKMLDRKSAKKVTFQDAAGVDEAKHELEEVVDFLRNPGKYQKLGARIPKGVLLIGPAGTGKTLLARAVANEAHVPFYSMAGSEFMEMLVGVGASRVRDLFKKAKENSPAVIFIDEIESIGRQRGYTMISSHGEQEQTLNQILVEMDGFTQTDHVIVLAATNRPDLLDSALTRPGRFDRTVTLQLPDIEGRESIISIHLRNKPTSEGVEVRSIAKRTVGFSGADLENMLNEAAILAAAHGKSKIEPEDIRESIIKVKLGRESRRIQSEEDKKMTAYHEAGHAIVAKSLPGMDPVRRVSIVSRGLALGFTEINPEVDRNHQTRKDLLNQVTALLGGRAAEEVVFNDMTVGAGNDLEKVGLIVNKMVMEYGMSALGPVTFSEKRTADFNRDPFQPMSRCSDEMAAKIDAEVKRIVDECYTLAKQVLTNERGLLERLVAELVNRETLEQEEFESIVSNFRTTDPK